jgi:metal-responsive CopG/Arc/MetJ family transcriptional regulator
MARWTAVQPPQTEGTCMASPLVVRDLSGDLISRLDAYANENGINRSAAVRLLLQSALGDSVQRAAIREAVAATANIVRPVIQARVANMHEEIAADLETILGKLE